MKNCVSEKRNRCQENTLRTTNLLCNMKQNRTLQRNWQMRNTPKQRRYQSKLTYFSFKQSNLRVHHCPCFFQ